MRVDWLLGAFTISVGAFGGCAMHLHETEHHAMGDAQSMCAMHKQMMAGKSAAEQQAMEQEHMRSMGPEMRQHMQEMLATCK